jgi:hypothetical protein
MDQAILVSNGQALVRALDNEGLGIRLAMWAHTTDTDTWKLWLVPETKLSKEKHEFYRRVNHIISKNRSILGGLESSDIELMSETHPAVRALKTFGQVQGLGAISFSSNILNGFFLPDGIVLRLNFSAEQPNPNKRNR